jgi:putative phage-type endonuclease
MAWLDGKEENGGASTQNASAGTHQTQGSRAWHEFRARHIGASEVSAVLGESDFMTPYQLWQVKTGEAEGFKGNWATQRGTDAEPEIRRLYEELYNVKTTAPVMEYQPWPILSASLDGYSEELGIVAEFKFPAGAKHEMAMRGEVPKTYRAQIQAQLLVSGCDTAHYVSYNGKSIAVVVVKADPAVQERILLACKGFWQYVVDKTPPPGSPVILESETLEVLATSYKRLSKIADETDTQLKLIRQKLDEIVQEDKAQFHGLMLTRSTRAGAVEYAKIPELQGVDLDRYRKGPTQTLTIKVKEE